MLYNLKKITKKHLEIYYFTKILMIDYMIYSSRDIECGRLKLVIMGDFCPLNPSPPKNPKNQFCPFGPFFALLPHYWTQKLKFGKIVKQTWRYYPFTHVYHKWGSYELWFLGHKARRTEFFVILGHFLPFYPFYPIFEKMKKSTEGIFILH